MEGNISLKHWSRAGHDRSTVVAIAVLAFVTADLSHEALGHGVAASLSGAKQIVLSYTYLSSDLQSRWVSGAGPLVNVVEGLLALLVIRQESLRTQKRLRLAWLLFLLFNFNLLVAAAYCVYSGVSNSGDLAVMVAGLPYLGAIRVALCVIGLALYGAVVVLGGRELRRFPMPHMLLIGMAYFAALGLDCGAALLNPLGLKYFLISALPTTAAANAGLFAMPGLAEQGSRDETSRGVERSKVWIVAGLVAAALFIFIVGPGLTWRR